MESFKVEVLAHGGSTWASNGCRFGSETEAALYAVDLASRWTGVKDTRIVPSTDPVSYVWDNGAVPIEMRP